VRIGAHESIAGGMPLAVERAVADGCESLQVFNKSSSQWKAKPLTREECETFRAAVDEAKLPVVSHGSYLVNLAGPEKVLFEQSVHAFAEELERCDRLGIPWLITHPGSHKGAGEAEGIERIAGAIDRIYDAHPGLSTNVLLENTAGMGACLGWRFEELGAIRAASKHARRIGICFDTCHAFAAGYDMRTREGYENTWAQFERHVGLVHLKAFHLNDSKKDLDCRVDRHESIGDGFIGKETFRFLVNDPRFAHTPGMLETPPLESGEMSFKKNLKRLRALREKTPSDGAQGRAKPDPERKGEAPSPGRALPATPRRRASPPKARKAPRAPAPRARSK
jgi:deoxyribonuclease-4